MTIDPPSQPDGAGEEHAPSTGEIVNGNDGCPEATVDCDAVREAVIERIQTVFDPEIPVNIHELGLIYDVDVQPTGNVHINMTLTSPACPSAQELPVMVRGAVGLAAGVKEVEVDVVFDPPWGPEKMSEAARLQLGMM